MCISSFRSWLGLGVLALLAPLALPCGLHAQGTVLLDHGPGWRYFKGTVAPPIDWATQGFVDTGPEWLDGETAAGPPDLGIGYGDADDITVLTDMQNGYAAFFARRAFTVSNLASITRLTLEIDYDDGFVAYLNGAEVARVGLGAAGSAVLFDQLATSREAGTIEFIDLPLGDLLQGPNTLAIELHNTTLASTDASLIPRLLGNADLPPTALTCTRPVAAGPVTLNWTNNGTYDALNVVRNGASIATLASSETTYIDNSPSTLDNVYIVEGLEGASTLPSNACTIPCTAGTLTCSLSLVGGVTQADLSWGGAGGVTSVQIYREDPQRLNPPLATLTNGETSYTDLNVEDQMPEDDTDYTVILTTASGTCTLTCGLSLCPNITAQATGDTIVLTINNNVKAWDHFEIFRNGAIVDPLVPGDATSWTDPSVILQSGNSYDYLLHPVAVPGGELPAPGTVCDSARTIGYAPEVGAYNPPAGGWDYSIEFSSPADLQYNPTTGQPGNLDGTWIRSLDRDFWDGSDTVDADVSSPAGPAPGGLDIVQRPSLGACGANTGVLRLLDPGDPTADWPGTPGVVDPFDVPNNRTILLGLDLGITDQNVLKSGVTVYTRLRLSSDSPAYMNANAASGDGAPVAAGIGMVGVYYKDTGALPGEGLTAGAAFSLNSNANGGDLAFSDAANGQDVDAIGTLNFVAIWMTIIGNDTTLDTYDVNVYLNGATTTGTEIGGTAISLGQGMADFGPSAVNYLAIASNDTGNDVMVEIDTVAYKLGVHVPTSTPCQGTPPNVPSNLNATAGNGQVSLTWTAPATGPVPTGYAVFRDGSRIANVPGSQPSYMDLGRTNGVEYCYRVRATIGLLESGDSNQDCATPVGGGGGGFVRGDTNGDGRINITDPIYGLAFSFQGGPPPPCRDAADADDASGINITDPIYLLAYLFQGGIRPPAPSPTQASYGVGDCGTDPTADNLDCLSFSPCP